VSVIVPHYNQIGALRTCLESLARQSTPREKFEIIVCDNDTPPPAHGPGVGEIVASFEGVRLVKAIERGAAPARNAGLAAARGRVFAFIDADCVADPDWLETGWAALSSADLVGGQVRVTVEQKGAPSAVEAFERVFAFRQRIYIKRKHFSVTANLFAIRSAAEAIGPFTNGVSEDVDWCHRAVALGFRLAFNDKSIVSHPARRDWEELVSKWDRLIRERWNGFGGRGLVHRLLWTNMAIATALSAAPHMIMVLTSANLSSARDRIAAAGVLARIRWWRAMRMISLMRASGAAFSVVK